MNTRDELIIALEEEDFLGSIGTLEEGLDLYDQNKFKEAIAILSQYDVESAFIPLLHYYDVYDRHLIYQPLSSLNYISSELSHLCENAGENGEEEIAQILLCKNKVNARDYRWLAWYFKHYYVNPYISIEDEGGFWRKFALKAWEMGDGWVCRLFVKQDDEKMWIARGCERNDDECLLQKAMSLRDNVPKELVQSAKLGNIRAMHRCAMMKNIKGTYDEYVHALKECADAGIIMSMKILKELYAHQGKKFESLCFALRCQSVVYEDTSIARRKLETVVSDMATLLTIPTLKLLMDGTSPQLMLEHAFEYALPSEIQQAIEM